MKEKDKRKIEELRANIARARADNKYRKASESHVQLARLLRKGGDKEDAIQEFMKVVDLAGNPGLRTDHILALREIAEMRSENGEQEQCFEFLSKYKQLVKEDPTDYQLMLSVAAYCYIKLYTDEYREDNLLEEAKRFAKKSLNLLDTAEMDTGKMSPPDDTISIRRLNCYRWLAEIAGYQNNKEEEEYHSQAALNTIPANDFKNRFEIMRARIEFPWRDNVKAAEELCAFANSSMKSKRLEARIYLAQAHFERREIEKGVETLLEINGTANRRSMGESCDNRKKYNGLLIFAYKVKEREKQLKKCEEENDQEREYLLRDKLADFYNNAGFKEAALHYYKDALNLAKLDDEKKASILSCAETSSDLKLYEDAARYFRDVLTMEERMEVDTSETHASLFEMCLFAGEFKTDADVNRKVDELKEEMRSKNFLIAVYNATAKYYEKKGNKDEAKKFRLLEDECREEFPSMNIDSETAENPENKDSLDEMSDEEILEIMRGKAEKKKLAKDIGKGFPYGETKLMERVRKRKLEDVMFLISQGVDVNKADPNGWTPLSEAVRTNNIEMVKFLLSEGANPNSESKGGWMKTRFAGNITPLMEACVNGYHEIATWFLNQSSANILVTSTNLDGRSPADFLTDYIERARRGSETEAEFQQNLDACKEVLEKMKEMQRKEGFAVRRGDPPPLLPKWSDTPELKAENENASGREEANDERNGFTENCQEAIGSQEAEKKEDDLFDKSYEDNKDEPLTRPLPSSNDAKIKKELTSDPEEEKMDVGQGETDMNGVQIKKATKRSVKIEVEDDDIIVIIPDDLENEEKFAPKRIKKESDRSSACGLALVRVVIEKPGAETYSVRSSVPSLADISDLPKYIDKLRNAINGANCEWIFEGDIIESMTMKDLAVCTDKNLLEIYCRIKENINLVEEFEKKCDASDDVSLLSAALDLFKTTHSLVIIDGTKYSHKTLDALWRAINNHSLKKMRGDPQWRAESITIEKFHVPSFALRALVRMRPREILSLRRCGINDVKLQEMIQELYSPNITAVECDTLDLSFNELMNPADNLEKIMEKFNAKTLILQGLLEVEHGCDLMTRLRGIRLNCLILDENPWLDDSCMQELMKDSAFGNLSTLKISKCTIRTMVWMEGKDSLKSLKHLSLSENRIMSYGWDRVAAFIRSTDISLQTLDISGTTVKPVILDVLAARSRDAPLLSVVVSRCDGITPAEICRAFGPAIHEERSPINVKLLLEEEKIEEVRATAPLIAAKVLEITPN